MNARDEELERFAMRHRIARACEAAHERACAYRSPDASEVAHIASGLASRWQFARNASRAELADVLDALARLHFAARTIDRLEQR